MNKKQLPTNIGKLLRLRPKPHDNGLEVDDYWLLKSVAHDVIVLCNKRTTQELTLGLDHVNDYRTQDYLVLKCQILITPNGIDYEPLLAVPKVTLTLTEVPPVLEAGLGLWLHIIEVRPSRRDAVADVLVKIEFDHVYNSGVYEVVRDDPRMALLV